MTITELDPYEKDLRRLAKRWSSLPEDMEVLKKVLVVTPSERPPFSTRLANLRVDHYVVKVRKIACRSLKGDGCSTGLRLVYIWIEVEERIVFVELYHKSERVNEDRERIKTWVKETDKEAINENKRA